MEELELRMYFFVPYQLTGIQQGIQSGHAALEFALKYGRYNPNHIIWDFIEKYKTWVILNGGTTNSGHRGSLVGSLNVIENSIAIYNSTADVNDKIDVERFFEPDLNDTMTAICFICDERVFDRVKYPDCMDFIINKMYEQARKNTPEENIKLLKSMSIEKIKEIFPEYYNEWAESIGGEKNVFLRELIKDKKLA
jgi:hypothetical protein